MTPQRNVPDTWQKRGISCSVLCDTNYCNYLVKVDNLENGKCLICLQKMTNNCCDQMPIEFQREKSFCLFEFSNRKCLKKKKKKKKQQPPTQNNPFQKQRKQTRLDRLIEWRKFSLYSQNGAFPIDAGMYILTVNQFATSLDRGNIERTLLFA